MLSRGNVPRQAIQYFASLAAVAVALVVRNELSRTIGSALPPFIFFYPAVMLVSLLAGLGPGLLTGATSAVATFTWIYPAQGRFSALAPGETLSLAIFLAVCVLMAAVAALYRQAKGRAAAYVVSLSRRESEARFSTVFHSSPMMMTISEVERGTLVDVNASFLEHCGLAREQVLGRKPRELGFQALEQGQVELMRELGQAASWESSLQTPSGGMETVLVSAQVIEVEGRKCLWTVIQDITEKKEAERELREREERYRGTLESMLVGCQTIGRNWTYLYVNSMAASHGRSTPDSLIGRRMTEVYPGIESTEMFAALRKCMEERVPVRTENEFRFPDGTSTWFDLSFQPVPEGVFILSYDISERKRSEEALRLSEEKFAQAFSGNPAAIALTRLGNGRFLEVNDRWVELIGRSREEVLGQSARTLGIWPDAQDAQRFVEALERHGLLRGWEQEFVTGSGARILTQLSATRLVVRGEQVILSTLVDITERKRAEHELRQNQQMLQMVIDLVPHFIFAKDRDSRHLFVNRACAEASGLTPDRMIGLSDRELVWEAAQRERFMADDREVIDRGMPKRDIEERLTDRTGRTRVLSTTKIPFQMPGHAGGAVLGVSVDITDLKHAEEEIHVLNTQLERRVQERTAELQAANRELESFAYAVSHDLRAPLRALNGFSQALLEDYGKELKGEAADYLEQIRLASVRMAELIDGILRLSRATRGELRREPVDLSALATRILGDLCRAEPGRKVSWSVEPSITAVGDARLVESVMDNLLGNAWKYTARAASPRIRFYQERRDGEVRFCVADNGAGFDMKHAERLFTPFQRLHRQEEFQGIGIGLATVQRIVQRHGGQIEASASPGEGAVFTFSLGHRPPASVPPGEA